jgi:hypothetical protein
MNGRRIRKAAAVALAVFGVALLISVLLLAASRMTGNRRAAAE